MPDSRADRWMRSLDMGLLVIGIGARLARFLEPRPLWIDEVLIALNVLPNGPADYLRPLGHSQISPVGFLIGEWLVTRVAGAGEHALRLLPFVASVVALVAFARLARRVLEPGMGLFATALAALSPLLVYYAGEAKSYSFDWLCAVLLMHATLSLAQDPTPRAWKRWALTAAFGALMSTAAPFFVGGCALALLAVPAIREPRVIVRLVVAVAPAALLFVAQLLTTYDSSYTRAAMESYWRRQFLDARLPDAVTQGSHLARYVFVEVLFGDRVADSLPPRSMTLIMLTSAVGTLLLARRSLRVAVMLFAPAVLAAAASMMHRWPLTPRLLLFVVPAVVMALASGLAALTRFLPSRARGLAFAGLSSLFVVGAATGVRWEWNQNSLVIALPDALRAVNQNIGSNAILYVSSDLVPACTYYLGWHPDRTELGGDSTRACAARGVTTLSGNWPLFMRRTPGESGRFPTNIRREWLDQEGARILAATRSELWLVLSHTPQLREDLPAWLERHGMRRLNERQEGLMVILEYEKGPS